jgi:hypothetical protein
MGSTPTRSGIRWLALMFAFTSFACSSTKPPEQGSVEFEAHRPTFVRALGAANRTGSTEANGVVDEQVDEVLDERGYQSGDRTRSATLHVVIETWGRFEREPHVRVSGRLFDDKTGTLIWSGAAEEGGQSSFADDEDSSWLESVLASCLDAAADALIDSQASAGRTAVESSDAASKRSKVHDLRPGEATKSRTNFSWPPAARVDLGDRAQLRVRAEHEVDRGRGPLDRTRLAVACLRSVRRTAPSSTPCRGRAG